MSYLTKVRAHMHKTINGKPRKHEYPVYDVTPFAGEIDLSFLEPVQWAPVWMTRAERLLLYTLIFTLRPKRYLEIGTFQGGSALLVSAAMDALDWDGKLICVDPAPKITPENWERIQHRATIIEGYSPDILEKASQVSGQPFDFVLIDGDHTYNGVMRDAVGVLPYVAKGGYLLFHDSLNEEVGAGIDDFLVMNRKRLVDIGVLTREITIQTNGSGQDVQWGGLRLMQLIA